MRKIEIVSTAPITLDRPVSGGEVLAVVETELTGDQLRGLYHRTDTRIKRNKTVIEGIVDSKVVARFDTEHSLATLLVMLQTGVAKIRVLEQTQTTQPQTSEQPETNASEDLQHDDSDSFVRRLKQAKATKRIVQLLAESGVTSVVKAKLYLAEHGGTFEPIDGIGPTIDKRLVAVFGD